ncbi:TPA: SDR family oxidoreductase [Candidatus Micrarchaeota archaeon]|nr:SDR family oxidoreductase [Candidatus Micrarchaeota archaeon]
MKTVLVTGGAKGLGKAIALKFASEGFKVCIDYFHSEADVKKTVVEINQLSKGFAFKCDVRSEAQVKKMVSEAIASMGSISVLVNNSGIYSSKPGIALTDLTETEWDDVMDTNLKGMFLVTKEVARQMIENKIKGRIINISSVAGLTGSPAGPHYTASKHGVIGFTKSIASQLAKHGILVNSVAPGAVLTDLLKNTSEERIQHYVDQTPTGSLSTPEDIADAVFFLAQARNITGQTLVVDGGRLMH